MSETPALVGCTIAILGDGLAIAFLSNLLGQQGARILRLFAADDGAPRTPGEVLSDRVGNVDVVVYETESDLSAVGLSLEAVRAARPRVVTVALPAFPGGIGSRVHGPSGERAANAACGLFTEVSLARSFLGLGAVYSALPHAQAYAAVHAATATVLALRARRSRIHVEVPQAAAGMSAMASGVLRVPAQPPRYDVPALPRAVRILMPLARTLLRRAPETLKARAVAVAAGMVPPLMDGYRCADGRRLFVFVVDHDRLARRLLERLGILPELLAEGLRDEDAYRQRSCGANLREGAHLSSRWRRRIRSRIARALASRRAAEWEADLAAAGVPCAVVRGIAEFLALPEVAAAGIVEPGEDGRTMRPGPHVWISAGPPHGPARPRTAPDRPGFLSGIRVLDLSTMVAGPVAARTLGEYGAEVVKIVAPRPHHGPRMTCWYGIDVDRGKRSVALDPRAGAGREALRRLLAASDIVVHNFTDAAAVRLGLSPEEVAASRSDAILCRIGAFRGPRPGPWSERKGYDPVVQSACGITLRYGDPGRPELHGIASCIDYLTGFSGAFAAALALLARDRDAEARVRTADTSLVQSALLIQAPLLDPAAERAAPRGQSAVGLHALARLYRARDGDMLLDAAEDALGAVASRVGATIEGAADVHDASVAASVARAIRGRTVAEWRERLAGIASVEPVEPFEVRRERLVSSLAPGDPTDCDGPFAQIVRGPHPAGGIVDTLAPGHVRISGAPLRVPGPAPKPGTHTREVLRSLGFTEGEIADMVAAGIAADEISAEYLPP